MVDYWQCQGCGCIGAAKTGNAPAICPLCTSEKMARIRGIDHSYAMHWTRVPSDEQELFDNVRGEKPCPSLGLGGVGCRARGKNTVCPGKFCMWRAEPTKGK